MTVAQLVRLLSDMPQDAIVRISVADSKDTAYTDEIQSVGLSDKARIVTVRGWVASDNERACAPWAESG